MTKLRILEWVEQELAKADEAVARGKLERAARPLVTAAGYDAGKKVVVVELANGASFGFSPSLAQGLEGVATVDLSEIEITPMGTGAALAAARCRFHRGWVVGRRFWQPQLDAGPRRPRGLCLPTRQSRSG